MGHLSTLTTQRSVESESRGPVFICRVLISVRVAGHMTTLTVAPLRLCELDFEKNRGIKVDF